MNRPEAFTARRIQPAGRTLATLALAVAAALLLAAPASALVIGEPAELETEEQQRQYDKLVRELRCTVCQSENIYESNAELAADMRRRVYRMTAEGYSEEEIVDFMAARYGDYVRYRPPVQANTALLWASPFLLISAGGLIWLQVVRQRRRLAAGEPLTEEQQAALERFRRGQGEE